MRRVGHTVPIHDTKNCARLTPHFDLFILYHVTPRVLCPTMIGRDVIMVCHVTYTYRTTCATTAADSATTPAMTLEMTMTVVVSGRQQDEEEYDETDEIQLISISATRYVLS